MRPKRTFVDTTHQKLLCKYLLNNTDNYQRIRIWINAVCYQIKLPYDKSLTCVGVGILYGTRTRVADRSGSQYLGNCGLP